MRQVVIALLFICFGALTASGQSWTFSKADIEFVIEFPSATWSAVSRVDVHQHPDFIYGTNERDGYLRLSKTLVASSTRPADLFQAEEKFSLQRLPGYVACDDCKGEFVGGHFRGATFSYEYTEAGKVMAGRIYYLQIDPRVFYALRFTAARDRLPALREQMDSIVRSFRLK